MPGGGQLALVSVGAQNTLFNGNPEETKFYKAYKRHTHFAQENITIPVDGPNELLMDSQIRLRAKLPRNADLMTDLVFAFELPAMYSKIYPQEAGARTPAFRWIHQIGAHIIASVGIYIGGTKVQEFPGEWIAVRASVDYPADKYQKWRTMIGDAPELNEPEWGVYGKSPNYPFQGGEYPHAVQDPAAPTEAQAPSVPTRTVRVPLPFWFTDSWGKALPLVALQLHEVEIQITLRSIREIFRIFEIQYNQEPCRPGRRLVPDATKPNSFSLAPPPPPPNYNLTLQNQYASIDDDPLYSIRNYFTDASSPTATSEGFTMNPRLEGNYVYVTQKEQVMFAERALSFLVHQVQVFQFPTVTARTRFDLEAYGLATRILFFGRRSDAIESRNDYLNLTNWKSKNQAPYVPLSAGTPVPNSGAAIPFYAERSILSSARLLLAGNEYYEEKPASFFEAQTPYMNAAGGGAVGMRPGDVMGPIYHFPLSLEPSDHVQPSGSLNVSRMREIQLEVAPTPLDPNGHYVYDFTVYMETMNLLRIQNGLAGMAWAI